MTVSCSAEGDEVDFTLSLDNNTLIHSRPEITESQSLTEITIRLHGQLVGKLVCDVQNNVSRKQTDVQVTGCGSRAGGPGLNLGVTTVAVISSVSALFLFAVLIRNKYLEKKNQNRNSITVRIDGDEDEVVYSDVRVTRAAR
ncbi:uncharacterized protein ACNS7B_016427 [Menidia menidia]